jgi:hypothetical protein
MTRSTACKGMSTPAQLRLSSGGSLGVLAAGLVCLALSAFARSMISSRIAQGGHPPRAMDSSAIHGFVGHALQLGGLHNLQTVALTRHP